jgi:phosphatidylglycerophosphatase A
MVWDFDTSPENQVKLARFAKKVWQHPLYFIASGFAVGLMPIFPGTFGSLVGLVLFFLLVKLPFWGYLLATMVVIAGSVWLLAWLVKETGLADPTSACIDEVAGILVALIGVPLTWYWLLSAFLLFRILDIFKPWPFSWLDKNIKGGFGMVLDDVAIGTFTAIIVQGLIFLF